MAADDTATVPLTSAGDAVHASRRNPVLYRWRPMHSPLLVPRPVPNLSSRAALFFAFFFLSQSGYCFTAGRYLSRQPDHSFNRILRTPLACHNEVLYDPCCCVRDCGPYVCVSCAAAPPDSNAGCIFPIWRDLL